MNYSDLHFRQIIAALKYVEDNFHRQCAVSEMANAAGCSLYHFSRMFNGCIKLSPYDYVIRRRLSESIKALLESGLSILEIALQFGFDSAEGYSRAVRKMFSLLPSEIRKRGYIDSRMKCFAIKPDDLLCCIQADYFIPEKIHNINIKLHGYGDRIQFSDLDEYLISLDYPAVLSFPPNWEEKGVCLFSADGDKNSEVLIPEVSIPHGEYISFLGVNEARD